jgi:hypothetical protein
MGEGMRPHLDLFKLSYTRSSWWHNLIDEYSNSDYEDFSIFLKNNTKARAVMSSDGKYFERLEFDNESDMTFFLIKYS